MARIALTGLAAMAILATVGLGRGDTRSYPIHHDVVATVFWVGEPIGNGSTENNAVSAYDDAWRSHFGGTDPYRPARRYPFFPPFRPRENPFYLDVPYDDFTDDGTPLRDRDRVVPWARDYAARLAAAARKGTPFSLMKNRWVKMWRVTGGRLRTCYGQVEDAGPYVYDDARYVFSRTDARPVSREANNAGMDVSPALRDCLGFSGLNNADNTLSWRFVDAAAVPKGPWRIVVTTRQVYWP